MSECIDGLGWKWQQILWQYCFVGPEERNASFLLGFEIRKINVYLDEVLSGSEKDELFNC